MRMRLTELTHCRPAAVDETACVVRGVKLIGRASSNGRVYTRDALCNSLPKYEGATAFVDHARDGQPRSYIDRLGEFRNVREQADGLYGDLHYNPANPAAQAFVWDALHNTRGVGFSHTADGRVARRGGQTIVEDIYDVISVDLVAGPATAQSLFEQRDQPRSGRWRQALKQAGRQGAALRGYLAEAVGSRITGDGDAANPATNSVLAAVLAILKQSQASDAQRLQQIEAVLGEPAASDVDATDDASLGEQAAHDNLLRVPADFGLQEQLADLQSRDHCRNLLEAAGVRPNRVRVQALQGLDSDDAREQLIVDWRHIDRPRHTARSEPASRMTEQRGQRLRFKTNEQRLAYLRGGRP